MTFFFLYFAFNCSLKSNEFGRFLIERSKLLYSLVTTGKKDLLKVSFFNVNSMYLLLDLVLIVLFCICGIQLRISGLVSCPEILNNNLQIAIDDGNSLFCIVQVSNCCTLLYKVYVVIPPALTVIKT